MIESSSSRSACGVCAATGGVIREQILLLNVHTSLTPRKYTTRRCQPSVIAPEMSLTWSYPKNGSPQLLIATANQAGQWRRVTYVLDVGAATNIHARCPYDGSVTVLPMMSFIHTASKPCYCEPARPPVREPSGYDIGFLVGIATVQQCKHQCIETNAAQCPAR